MKSGKLALWKAACRGICAALLASSMSFWRDTLRDLEARTRLRPTTTVNLGPDSLN